MNRILASVGIAAAIVCGSAAPALAADNPIDAQITYISSGGHYEDAKPENSMWGWVNPDGTTSWMITWVAEPGVKYNVHDSYTKLSTSVKCATGDTWDPNTSVYITAIPVNDYTIEFTAPEGAKTCVTYTPEPMATPAGAETVTNVAYVNGTKLERTIEVRGGTTGDGTTPAPAPSTTSSVPVPSHSETPIPSARPTKTAEVPKTSEHKLAKTGTNAEIAATLVIVIAAIGAVVYIISISRKEND